ncbi:MAG: hypothetical protein ACE5JR_11105 [Gemmatimonadota bacterium]
MRLALRFWAHLALWAGILLMILTAISLFTGQPGATVLAQLAAWSGLALALAAFPAGVAISSEALPKGRRVARRAAAAAAAAASVSLLIFVLGNWVGPAAQQWLAGRPGPAVEVADAARMSLGELSSEVDAAVARARAAGSGPEAVRSWQAANRLGWHLIMRTDGALLPLLLGLIGVLTGFWSRWFPRPELRHAQLWAMGLFLVMSTYLVGENSYELIVLRSAGPMFFAGDLVLVVPALLLVGLGWPTLVTLWDRRSRRGDA